MKRTKFLELLIIIFIFLLTTTGILLILKNVEFGYLILAIIISYSLLSFGTVKAHQTAAKLLFGDPIKDIGPGLYFAPLGIISVKKESGTFIQHELPCEPENIFRGEGKPPKGMMPPIRIKFGQPDPNDSEELKKDPYNVTMVAEVVPVVSYCIRSYSTFLVKMKTKENCNKHMADKAVEVFGDNFSTKTPAKALLTLFKTSQELETKLVTETRDWGIEIADAFVKPFIFSHEFNTAVIGIPIAKQKAEAVKIAATAEKFKETEVGAGKAEALRLLLEAEALGITKLAEATKTPEGQITLWMQTMQKAFEKAQYSIVPGSDLFTSIAGVKEMLDKIKGGNNVPRS